MLTAKCNTVLDVCAHLSSMSLARTPRERRKKVEAPTIEKSYERG